MQHGRFRRVAVAVAVVVVVTIAGGVTYAFADIGGAGVINGCYKSQNGQLRVIDPASDHCLPSETAISWSQTGPPATSLWAVVIGSNGSLARSSGVTASSHLATGTYQVDFNRNVTGCSYLATIGNPAAGASPPGEITTALRVTTTNAVFVQTFDSMGTVSDRNFHLAVFC